MAMNSAASRLSLFQSMASPRRYRSSLSSMMFSAMEARGTTWISWWTMLILCLSASKVSRSVEPPALHQHLPLVGAVDAADDLHQRALAGAVLTQESVDGAGSKGDAHPVQRLHAGKALADRPHFEHCVSSLLHERGPPARGRKPDSACPRAPAYFVRYFLVMSALIWLVTLVRSLLYVVRFALVTMTIPALML